MLQYTPGSSYRDTFTSIELGVGSATLDSVDELRVRRNGVVDATIGVGSVTEITTGYYEVLFTVPAGYEPGDYVDVAVQGTLDGVQEWNTLTPFHVQSLTINANSTIAVPEGIWASGDDLVIFHDARTLGTVLQDDNNTVDVADVPAHPVVASCLLRASGEVSAALNHCKRYTDAELATLTGASLMVLKGITCDLAKAYLMRRRITNDAAEEAADEKRAMTSLERLRKGEIVLDLEPQQEAGLSEALEVSADTIQSGPPLLRDQMSGPSGYFPKPRYKR